MDSVSRTHTELVGVRDVRLITGFRVQITFTDGTQREIDLDPYLHGPFFEPIRNDPKMFASIHVDPVSQTLAWSNGVDLAPETLYYGDTPPPWMVAWERKQQRVQVRAASHSGPNTQTWLRPFCLAW